jgi:hypothetical protein
MFKIGFSAAVSSPRRKLQRLPRLNYGRRRIARPGAQPLPSYPLMTDRGELTQQPTPARWPTRRLRLSPLGRDITVVVLLKLAALALLWWAFFSPPATRPPSVDPSRVQAHLVPSTSPEHIPHADP